MSNSLTTLAFMSLTLLATMGCQNGSGSAPSASTTSVGTTSVPSTYPLGTAPAGLQNSTPAISVYSLDNRHSLIWRSSTGQAIIAPKVLHGTMDLRDLASGEPGVVLLAQLNGSSLAEKCESFSESEFRPVRDLKMSLSAATQPVDQLQAVRDNLANLQDQRNKLNDPRSPGKTKVGSAEIDLQFEDERVVQKLMESLGSRSDLPPITSVRALARADLSLDVLKSVGDGDSLLGASSDEASDYSDLHKGARELDLNQVCDLVSGHYRLNYLVLDSGVSIPLVLDSSDEHR
jgi:hypothetical protein